MKSVPNLLILGALAAVLTACTPAPEPTQPATTAPRGPLEGVWKIAEVARSGGPNEGTNSSPQPSLYIFAKQHYSVLRVNGTEPRPLHEEGASWASLTLDEMHATFLPMTGNSGTYELEGSNVTFHPMVALSPNYMSGGSTTTEYRVEGNSLWLTSRSTSEPVVENRRRLDRLE